MLIQAYRRIEKFEISLFDLVILFLVNSLGHLVAEVTDDRAIARLLAIDEAYREYKGEGTFAAPASTAPLPAPVPAPAPAPATQLPDDDDDVTDPDAVLLGSSALSAVIDIAEGIQVPVEQVVESAFARSGFNREEWNLNDEDDREALLEAEVRLLIEAEQAKVDQANEAQARVDAQQLASEQTADAAAPAPSGAVDPLVLTAEDGTTINLGTMTEKEVRAFAEANGVQLPGGKSTKVAALREMVAKALTAPAA